MIDATSFRRRFGHLHFNSVCGRYVLVGWELHCGDGFQVRSGSQWLDVRIEMGMGNVWFLVGLSTLSLEGLEARSRD